MGGIGSGLGKRKNAKRTTEDLRALDVRALMREGHIAPGQEELIIEIPSLAGAEIKVRLVWKPSGMLAAGVGDLRHYLRPLLECPGKAGELPCGRHAAILYLEERKPPPQFLCRICLDLAYPSQRGSALDRAVRRREKARSKLGPDSAPRPKGMHHETFVRLGHEYLAAYRENAARYNEHYGALKWVKSETATPERRGDPPGEPL